MSPQVTTTGTPPSNNNTGLSLDIASALDMAQSRYFTVEIEGMGLPLSKNGLIMPVQNITYTIQGIDSLSLSLGIFKDIPIPNGIRVPRISLSLLDDDKDTIQSQFKEWLKLYMPDMGTVGYLSSLVKKMTYKSYGVDGTLNTNASFIADIMLDSEFNTTRDYSANDLKIMEAQVIIVS
jgi:hypothetical protein